MKECSNERSCVNVVCTRCVWYWLLEDITKAGEEELEEEDEDNKLINGSSDDHTNSNRHGVVVVSLLISRCVFCTIVSNQRKGEEGGRENADRRW